MRRSDKKIAAKTARIEVKFRYCSKEQDPVKHFLFIPLFLLSLGFAQSIQFQQIVPQEDHQYNQHFAWSIAVSDESAAIGASFSQIEGKESAGSVYMYEKRGAYYWAETQILTPNDPENYDYFGSKVSKTDDFVFITSRGGKRSSVPVTGAVYIFAPGDSGRWQQHQKLTLPKPDQGEFGWDTDAWGKQLIVGTRTTFARDSTGRILYTYRGSLAGRAFIYEYQPNQKWKLTATLNEHNPGKYVSFGDKVAIQENTVFVSAKVEIPDSVSPWRAVIKMNGKPVEQEPSVVSSSHVFVYEKSNMGIWEKAQILSPWTPGGHSTFGCSISAYGDYLAVGSWSEPKEGDIYSGGAVYIYKRNAEGKYEQYQRIVAGDEHFNQRFGQKVDLSEQYLIVGVRSDNLDAEGNHKKDRSGACYVFQRDQREQWVQTQKIVSDERRKTGFFGNAISVSGNELAIGSYFKTQRTREINNEGAAYMVQLEPLTFSDSAWVSAPILTEEKTSAPGTSVVPQVVTFGTLLLYPNPTSGAFTVSRPSGSPAILSIFDTQGSLIKEMNFKKKEMKVDLSDEARGIYLVRVATAQEIQTFRLVLQ